MLIVCSSLSRILFRILILSLSPCIAKSKVALIGSSNPNSVSNLDFFCSAKAFCSSVCKSSTPTFNFAASFLIPSSSVLVNTSNSSSSVIFAASIIALRALGVSRITPVKNCRNRRKEVDAASELMPATFIAAAQASVWSPVSLMVLAIGAKRTAKFIISGSVVLKLFPNPTS